MNIENLNKLAREARRLIIQIASSSKSAHVGSALSCVDLLIYLYYRVLYIDLRDWKGRDIFILSKAHAAMALYSVLFLKGIITSCMNMLPQE